MIHLGAKPIFPCLPYSITMYEKLNEGETIVLRRPDSATRCAYSGKKIPPDEHGIRLSPKDADRALAWISIRDIDQSLDELEEFDANEGLGADALSRSGDISYSWRGDVETKCLICHEESNEAYDDKIVFNGGSPRPWCHVDCIDGVIEAFDTAWDYSATLISERL